jgi:hypothetical protein
MLGKIGAGIWIIKLGTIQIPTVMFLKMTAFVSGVATLALSGTGVPIQDPWFDAFSLYYVFSAFTAGMPEPDAKSSFFYIWMYRSLHILSANGTAYFAHKNMWQGISSGKLAEPEKD